MMACGLWSQLPFDQSIPLVPALRVSSRQFLLIVLGRGDIGETPNAVRKVSIDAQGLHHKNRRMKLSVISTFSCILMASSAYASVVDFSSGYTLLEIVQTDGLLLWNNS